MRATFDSDAYQRGLKDARNACVGELLVDATGEADDIAYDNAVRDCVSAIERLMKHQVAGSAE